nr:MAG TPA: hypothetical protein [Caudoviricetes sp.]
MLLLYFLFDVTKVMFYTLQNKDEVMFYLYLNIN